MAPPDSERTTESGIPVRRYYTAAQAPPPAADPGEFPYTRGVRADGYRSRAWTMRQYAGFGSAGRDQRALPPAARARPDRPVGGLRPADPAGPRLRPRAGARRGRPHRRRHRLAGGHGAPAGRDPAGRRVDVDDDQRPGVAADAALRAGRGRPGRLARPAVGHRPERHPQGVHRPRQLHLPGPAEHAADRGHVSLLHRADAALEHDLDLRLPHPRGRLDGRAGARLHAGQRHRLRPGGGRRRPRGRLVRAPALVLLQRPQRRLPGDREVPGGPYAVGARSCATGSARPMRAARCCGSTRRPAARR